jgi:membrane protein YdbS with pleckstrin-like domain
MMSKELAKELSKCRPILELDSFLVSAVSVWFATWLMSYFPEVFWPNAVHACAILWIAVTGLVAAVGDIPISVWRFLRKRRKAAL